MTWGRYDDYAPFHRKWLTLSNDAVATMWRATTWARSRAADARPGFVTRKELRALSGGLSSKKFERVLQELIDAGRPAHEFGLLEALDDGFMIHNFDRYGAPDQRDRPQVSSARSEAGRAGGQRSAARRKEQYGSAQPTARPEANAEANSTFASKQTPKQNDFASKQNGAPVPDPGREPKAAAAAAKDLTGSAREETFAAAAAPTSSEKVSCPKDLELTSTQREQLHSVPDYAVSAGTVRFRAKYVGAPERRSLLAWQRSLSTAIHGMWSDSKQRPSPPESFEKPGPVKAKQVTADVGISITADGRQVRA